MEVCAGLETPVYRGREEPFQALLSLRTVHAVLPHTALQSIVSSSGSARLRMGFHEGEKSQACEVGIRPLLMVSDVPPGPAPFLLVLAQDTSESTPYKAVHCFQLALVGVFKVVKPAPQYRIESFDNGFDSNPLASSGMRSYLVPHGLSAFLADEAPPLFEGVAQKVESVRVVSFVDEPCLVRMQFELLTRHPLFHFGQGCVGFRFAGRQDDEVIRVAYETVKELLSIRILVNM
jgi:hypothetical protein